MASLLVIVLWAGWAQAATPSKSKVHGVTLSGTVASVDESKKTLVVKSATGKQQTTLVWTSATRVFGGKLAAGQSVTLKYLDREGKHIATSIQIRIAPSIDKPSPTAPPPAPTASRSSR